MTGTKALLTGLLIGVGLTAAAVAVSPQLGLRPVTLQSPAAAPTAASAAASSADFSFDAGTFRRIADAQTPMVVNIRSEARRQTRRLSEFFGHDDPLRQFFDDPRGRSLPREEILEGAGSGFIIDKAGLILTNNHVVAGATKIEVGLFPKTPGSEPGSTYEAKVIGRDPLTDSALIQIVERLSFDLPVARFGDSNQAAPGDWVVAIGNPFNLSHTVTVGVISAKERPFRGLEGRVQEMLQTDAAVNPGNSGGPLLNLRGDVIGINTAILSSIAGAGNIGIGFAVPIHVVRELLPQLQRGKVTRGRIGVVITDIPREAARQLGLSAPRGALVAEVEPGGPAARAGLQPGDIIVEYQGTAIEHSGQLVNLVADTPPSTTATMKVLRDKETVTLNVRVAELDLAEPPTK